MLHLLHNDSASSKIWRYSRSQGFRNSFVWKNKYFHGQAAQSRVSWFLDVISGLDGRERHLRRTYFRSSGKALWVMSFVRLRYKWTGTSSIALFTTQAWARQVRRPTRANLHHKTRSYWLVLQTVSTKWKIIPLVRSFSHKTKTISSIYFVIRSFG